MTPRFFKHLYFLRFSFAGWLFLPVLCGLDAMKTTSSITRAILTLDSGWQVYYATFFVVAQGMTVLITARNTVRNGPLRFCDVEDTRHDRLYALVTDPSDKALWKVFGIAHIPTLTTLFYLAWVSKHECETFVVLGPNGYWVNFFIFMLAGLVAAAAFWYIVSLFYYWTYRPVDPAARPSALLIPHKFFGDIGAVTPPPRLTTVIDWVTSELLGRLSSEGYSKAPGAPVWELHFLSAISLAGIFLLYAFLFPLTAPVPNGPLAFAAEIIACVVVTGTFIYAIENAGSFSPASQDHPTSGVFCNWARPVKYGFIALTLIIALLFLASVAFDQWKHTVRLEMAFPTFGSVLVLSVFFLWLFAGAAFFLDRYRIPVLTAALFLIFIPKCLAPLAANPLVKHNHPWLAEFFDSDHFFTVKQLSGPLKESQIPDPASALSARVKNLDEPYIIVTASGGGIRAAEWTAQVMAQLEQRIATDDGLQKIGYSFHDHLVLASGVSGGSVGLMPYLLEYTGKASGVTAFPSISDPAELKHLADRIVLPPACSGLEAVGWGLSYRDLLGLFSPLRIPPISRHSGVTMPGEDWVRSVLTSDTRPDRSWALAESFNRNMNDVHCGTFPKRGEFDPFAKLPKIDNADALTLAAAAHMLEDGRMPAFTFNTTAEETGSRFLLSNYLVRVPAEPTDGTKNDFVPAESFLQAYAVERGHDDASFQRSVLNPGREGPTHEGNPLYADLSLSTAARLSATFPIVSSGTRIPPAFLPHAYHFLDGGYFDNDGTSSVIEFLKSALDNTRGKKIKILLIEIRDDDGKGVTQNMDTADIQNDKASNWTQLTQLTGLVGGLWNAGHSSISRRNRRELCTVEEKYQTQLDLRQIVFTIPNDPDGVSPLNWKLTGGQNTFIRDTAQRENDRPNSALLTVIANIRDMLPGAPTRSTDVAYPSTCDAATE